MKCEACGAANEPAQTWCGSCGGLLMGRTYGQGAADASGQGVAWGLRGLLLLCGYVFLSSYFGLTGRFLFFAAPLESLAFMASVWLASAAADFVFLAGSVATGVGAYLLARGGSVLGSLAVGLLGTWTTYALSWAMVLGARGGGAFADAVESLPGLFAFVGGFGIAGLAVGTFAPALLGARDRAAGHPGQP